MPPLDVPPMAPPLPVRYDVNVHITDLDPVGNFLNAEIRVRICTVSPYSVSFRGQCASRERAHSCVFACGRDRDD